MDKVRIASIFIIFFFIGDWIYTMKNNENVMYYYYVNYPLAMKYLETNIYHAEKAIKPFIEIIPKEKY